MAGDQQTAAIGLGFFSRGDDVLRSMHRLLTTVVYRFNSKPTYALEGTIFVAGAAIQ